jgi:hypothetical protein
VILVLAGIGGTCLLAKKKIVYQPNWYLPSGPLKKVDYRKTFRGMLTAIGPNKWTLTDGGDTVTITQEEPLQPISYMLVKPGNLEKLAQEDVRIGQKTEIIVETDGDTGKTRVIQIRVYPVQ